MEILISIVVFAILMLSGTSLMAFINKQVAGLNNNIAIQNTMNQVKYAFGDDERYCEKILGDLPGGTPRPFDINNPQGVSISTIDFYDLVANLKKENAATTGKKIDEKSSVVLRDIRLKPVATLSTSMVLASLDFIFENPDKTGPSRIVRNIPIHITMQGNAIKRCSAGLATNLAATRKCEMDSNGYYYWDPLVEECLPLPGVKEFESPDPFFAACPVGWVPAASKEDPWAAYETCITDVAPVTIPSRAYKSGFVDDYPVKIADEFLDFATGKCRFAYPTTGFQAPEKTAIKCAKIGLVR